MCSSIRRPARRLRSRLDGTLRRTCHGDRSTGFHERGRSDRSAVRSIGYRHRATGRQQRAGRWQRAALDRMASDRRRRSTVDRAVAHSARRLDVVDLTSMQVTVGAGVTLAEWREHAHASGLDTPDRLRRTRRGDDRRCDRHERRWVAGAPVRDDALAGRRHRSRPGQRCSRRLAGRSAEGDRRRPLAVAHLRLGGHAGDRHRGPTAARARSSTTPSRR